MKKIPSEEELGFLKANLIDQYYRADSSILMYENRIIGLPKGYISEKNISGKKQYYLQWREMGKLKSKYIKKEQLEDMQNSIKMRKEYEKSLKYLRQQKKEIERFVGKEVIEFYGEK